MRNKLKKFSTKYDLEYFTDEKNFPNQELQDQLIKYFDSGPGARVFKPIDILNLLEMQSHFVFENCNDKELVIATLSNIPLSDLERHVFYGMIIKRFGGYPVNNLNEDLNLTLKKIQAIFLDYPGETPEKEFCKVNALTQQKFMKYGIAFTASINSGIPVGVILENLKDELPKVGKSYNSFDEFFKEAMRNDAFGEVSGVINYLLVKSKFNFEYNIWLNKIKGWDIGDENNYSKWLTKSYFLEFRHYQQEEERKVKEAEELERQSWNLPSSQSPGTENKDVRAKPILNPNFLDVVYDVLKDFFNKDQQFSLRTLLATGEDANEPLIFLDSGNRLADAFKKLKKEGIITGCLNKELEAWILRNFKYRHRKDGIIAYKSKYLNSIISSQADSFSNPILKVITNRQSGQRDIIKA